MKLNDEAMQMAISASREGSKNTLTPDEHAALISHAFRSYTRFAPMGGAPDWLIGGVLSELVEALESRPNTMTTRIPSIVLSPDFAKRAAAALRDLGPPGYRSKP